jgi:hypothetical protein
LSTRHPTLPYWLEYLRTQRVPFVKAGELRDQVICDTERAGLAELAEGLRQLVDWRRTELQALLARKAVVNLHGARLRGQDLTLLRQNGMATGIATWASAPCNGGGTSSQPTLPAAAEQTSLRSEKSLGLE